MLPLRQSLHETRHVHPVWTLVLYRVHRRNAYVLGQKHNHAAHTFAPQKQLHFLTCLLLRLPFLSCLCLQQCRPPVKVTYYANELLEELASRFIFRKQALQTLKEMTANTRKV